MRQAVELIVALALILGSKSVGAQSMPLAKTVDKQHDAVVAVFRVDSLGRSFVVGSGVLIHPRVVLTAGHVNYEGARAAPGGASAEGFIAVGENALNPDARFQFAWVDDVASHPETGSLLESLEDTTGSMDLWAFADVGLVFLRAAIEDRLPAHLPSPHALERRSAEDSLVGVGFGYHMVPDSTFSDELVDGLRRRWSLHSATLVNERWLSTGCDSVRNLPYIGPHDSGGPLLMNDEVVLGVWSITALAEEPCLYGSAAVRIDNPAVLEWVRARVQERLGVELREVDEVRPQATPQKRGGTTGSVGRKEASSHNTQWPAGAALRAASVPTGLRARRR